MLKWQYDEMIKLVGDILMVDPADTGSPVLKPDRNNNGRRLDVSGHKELISRTVHQLVNKSIALSLFVDPDPSQIEASAIEGVDMVEINTAKYAEGDLLDIERIRTAAQIAESLGLTVAAGHGLTHHNLGLLVREVPEIVEYNIGHSIVS